MTLDVNLGEIVVPTSKSPRVLDICLVWLDKRQWSRTSFEKQKEIYAFVERRYKKCQIFYCSKSAAAIFELEFACPAAADERKISEDTLKRIFTKYVQPLIKSDSLQTETISVPNLSIKNTP